MKRFLAIAGAFLVSLLMVSAMLVAVLTSDKVETAAVQFVTEELSRALGTEAHVGAVEYRFPARVAIKDVLIEDRLKAAQHDTLAYIGEVYVHFSPLALRKGEIRFSHAHIHNVVAKLYRTNDVWNFQYLVEAFRSDEERVFDRTMESIISVRDVELENIRVEVEQYTVQLPKATMDLNNFSEESLDAQIRHLEASVVHADKTQQPFEVEDLQAHVLLTDSTLQAPTLKVQLPRSRVDLSGVELCFPAADTIYLSQSAHDITFALRFHEAELVPADIALFIPLFSGLKHPINLSGALVGTLDSVMMEDIALHYNGHLVLQGDVTAIGLPDLSDPYLRANLRELQTNAPYLQDFLAQLYGHPFRLPKPLHRLGDIHYRGLMEGYLHNLTLHGGFRTALGAITTDGTVVSDSTFEHMNFDAHIVGNKFRVGRLLDQSKLGSVTLDFYSKGSIDEGKVHGDIKAHIRDLTYNHYTFSDIKIDGRYDPLRYEGNLAIHDPHVDFEFDGVLNRQDENPEYNFNLLCRHFDLSPFSEYHEEVLRTSFALAVDLNGAKADEISGYLVLDSLYMATPLDSIRMRQLTLLASAHGNRNKSFTLRSDNTSAQLDGYFRYQDVVPALRDLIHYYLPSTMPASDERWMPVEMRLRADGARLRDIQRLFASRLTISDHSSLQAEVNLEQDEEPEVSMNFFAPGIRAASTPVHDLSISLNSVDTLLTLDSISFERRNALALSVSAEAMQMQTFFTTLAFRDSLYSHVTLRSEAQINELLPEGWENLSPRELRHAIRDDVTHGETIDALLAAQRAGDYGGDLRFITHFSKYNKQPLIDLHLLPCELILRDSIYTLSESNLTYCAADTALWIEHFAFEGAGQHLRANGIASTRRDDTLAVDLQRVDASYVVPFILPVQTIMFNGLLTGVANITGVFRQPLVETQIHIDSVGLNNCYFGDAEVDLHVYPKQILRDTVLPPQLRFHADVYRPITNDQSPITNDQSPITTRTMVNLNGMADFDGSGVWNLDMDADSVPLDFINHWTANVLRDIDGHATGKVVVGGRKGMVYVLLDCMADDASLTLPWTNARYTIRHDNIIMDTTAIRFPNVHLVDVDGNPVEVNGAVYHDKFRDFVLDLHVDAHDALVFDNNRAGEMLQGAVYATGHVDVTGPQEDIVVAADARTSHHSRFRLSIDNTSSAYESNFIHFVEHSELDTTIAGRSKETDLDNIDNVHTLKLDTTWFRHTGRCLLKLNLDVNPQLLFQLVIGERNGDMIQGRGNGALRLTYDTQTGDVTLQGTYDIDQGTLSYTVANMIRREFTVGEGAKIVFSGDATNPQLDVTAKYRVTANLKDLFGEDISQLATSRTSIPVLTCLHLTGFLNNPILSFSLEFPTSDQSIQQQVRQVINSDEMLMRQVIYLLVFGRFFTPDYMSNAQYATINSTYSLLSSTVTGQINAWLSKLTNVLTVGVAIRTEGEGAGSSQEYEAQFQLQPVDRLLINGNVGYRYNDVSNQPFFGDLDVEVLLTEDGQWRLKGYTHTVDKYSLRQASTIQGVGVVWKKDF